MRPPGSRPIRQRSCARYRGSKPKGIEWSWTRRERLAASMRMASDPKVDIAIAVRGGYGWSRLLDSIDFGAIAAARKWWLGHSDFTAFQLSALAHEGMVSFAGPMAAYDFGAEAPCALRS